MTFIAAQQVRGRYVRTILIHSGDSLHGMPYDLEDIEVGDRVRGELFCQNVLGFYPHPFQ